MSETGGHEYLKSHKIAGNIILREIDLESKAILEVAREAATGHAAKTLIKEGPLRIVILGFTPGSRLQEHRAGGPVSIQALSGSVDVATPERSEMLTSGEILVLASDVQHSVVAKDYSVLLLTIARTERE